MRSASRRSMFAVAVSLLALAACSDVLHQSAQPARLDLSLTGPVPERIEAFELEVSAPGMATVTEQLGPRGSGTTTLELPAGRNRRFNIFSINEDGDYDVYAGETVASVAPGRETRVRVPVTPGPVIVDNSNNRFVQISDIGNRAQRVVDGEDIAASLNIDPMDASYDSSGRLWVVDGRFSPDDSAIIGFASLSDVSGSMDVRTDVVYRNSAIAVDSANERIFVYGRNEGTEFEWGVWTVGFGGNLLTAGSPIQGFAESAENLQARNVSGLAVDSTGEYLFVLAATLEEPTPTVHKLNIANGTVVRSVSFDSPAPGLTGKRFFGDVMVMSDRVFVADPIDRRIRVFDLDLTQIASYGTGPVDEERPDNGELWGPRRFVATMSDEQIIVIDQQDNLSGSETFTGRGRVVGFRLDQPDIWRVLEDDDFAFFGTFFS